MEQTTRVQQTDLISNIMRLTEPAVSGSVAGFGKLPNIAAQTRR
jgi:hypothetical protein